MVKMGTVTVASVISVEIKQMSDGQAGFTEVFMPNGNFRCSHRSFG